MAGRSECGGKTASNQTADTQNTDQAEVTQDVTEQSVDNASDFDLSSDITVVSREDGSGTRGAFVELLGIEVKDDNGDKVDMTTLEAEITNSTSVMMTSIAGDEYAIGYISLGSLNDPVKALSIAGAVATAANITHGS